MSNRKSWADIADEEDAKKDAEPYALSKHGIKVRVPVAPPAYVPPRLRDKSKTCENTKKG